MTTARTAPAGVVLREITKVVGPGPDQALIELAEWGARRWAGRRLHFLRAATPLPSHSWTQVAQSASSGTPPQLSIGADEGWELARQAFEELRESVQAGGLPGEAPSECEPPECVRPLVGDAAGWVRVLRWAPGRSRAGIALAVLQRGPCLLLTPSQHDADLLERALRTAGHPVGRHPRDWASGAGGGSVVGSRAAAWAPVGGLRTIVVFDEHDERYQDERTPTWNARDVAVERGRRAGAVVLLVSPVPSPEAVWRAPILRPSRHSERLGWPQLSVIDRRELDPREGLYPAALVAELRAGGRTIVVYNRTGRARLLACTRCGELCRCDRCGAALRSIISPGEPARDGQQGEAGDSGPGIGADVSNAPVRQVEAARPRLLRCSADGSERPEICGHCGATRLAVLRAGVSRVREELEALVGEPVEEITGASAHRGPRPPPEPTPGPAGAPASFPRVVVGTSAVLHRVHRADAVIFLDLDQELLAPRYRAGSQAMAQLALAARILGGRQRGGRLVVQTRQPDHEVLQAVLHADPEHWLRPELQRRADLQLPPTRALALLEGGGAAAFAAELVRLNPQQTLGAGEVTVLGPTRGRYLVRALDHEVLSTALRGVLEGGDPTPGGPVTIEKLRFVEKLRIVVDPPGI